MTQIQVRQDTATNWSNASAITPASGEFCYQTDGDKLVKIGDGSTKFTNLPHFTKSDEMAYAELSEHLYNGVDLKTKFATEIAGYSDEWAWLKARKNANNFAGIHVGDYMDVALSAGTVGTYNITAKTLRARIIGIDTYYRYGDAEVGHHIDFKTDQTVGTNMVWNPNNNNNGTADEKHPWLASAIYAYLNGVNNYSTNAFNSVAHGADASGGGILQLLPTKLTNQIIQKRMLLPERYSASGLLTVSSAWSWGNMGKLWLPTEIEVYGCPIHSAGKGSDGRDYENGGSAVQYPLFAGTAGDRNKKTCGRAYWWLSSVTSGSSTYSCLVYYNGSAAALSCSSAWSSAPVCFRI